MARLSFQMTDHQMKRLTRHGCWRALGPAVTSRVRAVCIDEPELERAGDPCLQPTSATIPAGWERVFEQEIRSTRRQTDNIIASLERHGLTLGDRHQDLALLHIDYQPQDWPLLEPLLAPLQRDLGLVFAPETAVQAGYRLYQGRKMPLACKGMAPSLTSDVDVHHALAAILRGCLAQWLGNHAGVSQVGAVDAVHQMRVALRRLRAVLSLFRTVSAPTNDPNLSADLRNLALILGPVRDRDVFLAEIVPPASHALDDADRTALVAELAEQRQSAWEQAAAIVLGSDHLALVIRLEQWLEQLDTNSAGIKIGDIAPALLEKRLKRVRRLGRDLENRSADERHELRIALKKLRYSLEFLGILYDDRRLSKALAHLVELQQILGLLNDVVTAHRLVADLHNPAAARAGGIVVGWNHRDSEQKLRHLVRAWDDFCDLKPFWRRAPKG